MKPQFTVVKVAGCMNSWGGSSSIGGGGK